MEPPAIDPDLLLDINKRTLFEAFEKFVWQPEGIQQAIGIARSDWDEFPSSAERLIGNCWRGRWPLSISIEKTVLNLTQGRKPKSNRRKNRNRKTVDAPDWIGSVPLMSGARVVAPSNTKVRKGIPQKPESVQNAYRIIFNQYKKFVEHLRSGDIRARGKPLSGNREEIPTVEWKSRGSNRYLLLMQNALFTRDGKTWTRDYTSIEIFLPQAKSDMPIQSSGPPIGLVRRALEEDYFSHPKNISKTQAIDELLDRFPGLTRFRAECVWKSIPLKERGEWSKPGRPKIK